MELPGWDRAGFDDAKWEPAQVVDAPAGALAAEMAEPLRVTDTLHPVSVKQLQPGVYIFDMGQNMVGWCRLRVAGPKGAAGSPAPRRTLKPDGSLYVANLRTARATDVYTLKGAATEVWEPRFTYHGFRFVEVTGFPGHAHGGGAGRAAWCTTTWSSRPISPAPTRCLNQIHHNVFWGIRGNYRSIPTDCPQRDERQGWLGDRSQVSRSESYMFDVAAFYTKWTPDLADSQRPTAACPTSRPITGRSTTTTSPGPAPCIFVPGMLYDQYGDKRVLERDYPAMRKWLEHEQTLPEGRPDLQRPVRRLVRAAGRSQADPFAGPRAHHR